MLHLNGSCQACEGLQQEWSILNSEGVEMGRYDDDDDGSQIMHFIEVNVSVCTKVRHRPS
jgi:hypothetical protein